MSPAHWASHSAGYDCRTQARALEAFLLADLIDAPSNGIPANGIPGRQRLVSTVPRSTLNSILASQSPDGGLSLLHASTQSGGYAVPFMVGLLNDVMIEYYQNFEADPRILGAIKSSLDYIWHTCWNPATNSFVYIEHDYNGETRGTGRPTSTT